ncbi:hypothetical protein WS88_33050 [Burkholderia cepacia]|nr:hypothetical protein WS88_33050 [Burkholderia cepacia]KVL05748.1 hypothetical protein WS93_05055 [Burkholderia cepacia]
MANTGFHDEERNNVPIGSAYIAFAREGDRCSSASPQARGRELPGRATRSIVTMGVRDTSHGSDARDTGGMLPAQRKSGSFPDT